LDEGSGRREVVVVYSSVSKRGDEKVGRGWRRSDRRDEVTEERGW